MKSHRFTIVFTLCFALAPVRSMADISATLGTTKDRSTAHIDTDGVKDRHLLELFRATRLSLSEAMAIAEKLHQNARTAQISFDVSSSPAYRVRTVLKERVWDDVIDAQTGSVGGEIALPLSDLGEEDRNNIAALESVRQDLAEATRVAERISSGRAFGGGLMKEDGRLNFVVVVLCEVSLKQVMLEPPQAVHRRTVPQHSP